PASPPFPYTPLFRSALVEWLHDLPVDVWHWMGYTRRPPQKDCFRDLLMALDPDEFQAVLSEWISETLELELTEAELAAVSVDGKDRKSTRLNSSHVK